MPLVSFFCRCCWWKGFQLKQLFTHASFSFLLLFIFPFPASISPLLNILPPYRKNHINCSSLLSELTQGTARTRSSIESRLQRLMVCILIFQWTIFSLTDYVLIPNKTPEHRSNSVLLILVISGWQDSGKAKPASSRWKEELELLLRCLFSPPPPPQLSKYIFNYIGKGAFDKIDSRI